eukprot:TRINITY_DN302_c0_g1_i1.p1 TRINITY_DN302_c0_g1~~TRINITY_DN302_c0_g1_i1.p1  ORF type:complete len:165 (+),score=58.88 TRINITY_DN302_c0_g1_i1:67-561(+)
MMSTTNFTEGELRRLYRRFKKLEADTSTLSPEELAALPDLRANPLLGRLLAIFDKNKDDEIQFSEFVSTLSTLSNKGSHEQKLRFAFQVYDVDGDGYISNGELFSVLKMMVGGNFSDVQLQQVVDKTIVEADEDKDGKISFDEFAKIIAKNSENISDKLTINWQ